MRTYRWRDGVAPDRKSSRPIPAASASHVRAKQAPTLAELNARGRALLVELKEQARRLRDGGREVEARKLDEYAAELRWLMAGCPVPI